MSIDNKFLQKSFAGLSATTLALTMNACTEMKNLRNADSSPAGCNIEQVQESIALAKNSTSTNEKPTFTKEDNTSLDGKSRLTVEKKHSKGNSFILSISSLEGNGGIIEISDTTIGEVGKTAKVKYYYKNHGINQDLEITCSVKG